MVISVSGLSFMYRASPVLKDIGFELPKGKILALLGVNGAGKSTLLRCLAGMLPVHEGSVKLDGQDITLMRKDEVARHFAYVPQYLSHPSISVFDMVLLGRKPHMKFGPCEQDLNMVRDTLDLMGLEKLAMRRVDRLSGGEVQKVVMARALVQDPEVLLLDEPTSNLDLSNQLQVMDLMQQAVEKRGLCAVVSVHDINLAFRYADLFLMLRDGSVEILAPKEEIGSEAIGHVYGVEVILDEVQGYRVVIPVGSTL